MHPLDLSRDLLIKELKNTTILRDLTPRELKRFSAICEVREYALGERIVEQDAIGLDLDILIAGSVDIALKGGHDQAEVIINTIQRGDILGEAAIFMDLPRTASAVARGGCTVVAIPRDSLFAFCERNPKAGLKIFTVVIYSLLKRLGATSRDLVAERESVVTNEELERLRSSFPKSLEDMLEG